MEASGCELTRCTKAAMSKDKRPWMKFFVLDWLGDAELRGCTLAAPVIVRELLFERNATDVLD